MDNCFTSRRDRSRQMPEKNVLYRIPAGPVTECAFAMRHIVLPSCLDSGTSQHLFRLPRGVCRRVFNKRRFFEVYCKFIHFILLLHISTEVSTIMSSPGQKRGTCGHVMASFDGHLKCVRCRDKGVGEDNCILKDCPICKAYTIGSTTAIHPHLQRMEEQRQENGFCLPYPHSRGPFRR